MAATASTQRRTIHRWNDSWMIMIFLLLISISISTVSASVIRVQDDDPRIKYSPDVMSNGRDLCQGKPGASACLGHWWIQNDTMPGIDGSTHWTCGSGNSLKLTFSGTAIAWYAFPGYTGPIINITIDNGPTTQIGRITNAIAFQLDGLDPSKDHTLVATHSDAPTSCIGLDYFQVMNPDNNFATAPTQPPSHSSANKTGPIIGIVLGSLALVVAGIVLFILFRPRPQLDQGKDFAEDISKPLMVDAHRSPSQRFFMFGRSGRRTTK